MTFFLECGHGTKLDASGRREKRARDARGGSEIDVRSLTCSQEQPATCTVVGGGMVKPCKSPLFSPWDECQNAHIFFEQAWRGRPLTPPFDSRGVVSMMVRVLMMATTSNTKKNTDLSSVLCDLSDQHLGTCDWRHARAFKSLHIQWNSSADTQIGFSRPCSGGPLQDVLAALWRAGTRSRYTQKKRADVNSTYCVR